MIYDSPIKPTDEVLLLMKYPLYQALTESFRQEINSGMRRPGDRMPSVRQLCASRKISKSTVLSAYSRLESEGLIVSKLRSGYFVQHRQRQTASVTSQQESNPESRPLLINSDQVIIDIMEKGAAFDLLPDNSKHDENVDLRRCLARAYRQQSSYQQNYYNSPQGTEALRQQIVNRLHSAGSHLEPDELLITSGCQNALLLALMATTSPGDIVAIESPGFYGAIQLIEALGLHIVELASSPAGGINLDLMTETFKRWKVRALMISPCYATPTGSSISDANKQGILDVCMRHGISIIEDDIYGELYFGLERPRTLHSFDPSGNVLLCSSLSKSLSRDLRIGWIAPGKHLEKIKRLKVATSLASSITLQEGIADYMQRGWFERYLRQKRLRLAQQCSQLQSLVAKHIPNAVSWTQPQGGLSLWLELDRQIDTIALYRQMQAQGITLTPGALFTAQQNYNHFLRLSFAHEWTEARVTAIRALGQLVERATP
jgi:DNA-binding transcriptional MocR family regulator